MKNFTILLTFICSCFAANLFACTCLYGLSFCETAKSDSKIVEVEVIEKYSGTDPYTYMDVQITETLQGTVTEEKLSVISFGTSCDVFFDAFEIGEKLVLNFNELEQTDSVANFPSFSFAVCARSYLRLSNNELSGSIKPDVSTMNYDDFKNSIGSCADLTLFDRNPEALEENIYLTPNPTTDMVYIYSYALNPAELSFQVFSSNGQLITSINNLTNYEYILDLSNQAKGIYFVRIRYRELSLIKRIVKI